MSTVAIELTIAGQRYPLRVSAADEKMLRKAETEINERLKQLQDTPGARNAQDHMAMLLLTAWVEKLKNDTRHESDLRQLHTKLDQTFKTVDGLFEAGAAML